jgi:hypothetical protein
MTSKINGGGQNMSVNTRFISPIKKQSRVSQAQHHLVAHQDVDAHRMAAAAC